MKKHFFKTVLFIGFCSIINYSAAQNALQQWNIGIYDESFSPEHPKPTWYTYLIKSKSDTLINNLNYKKLYKSLDSLFINYSYFGGLRIDSNKVLINQANYQNNILLYDFNLNVNDTATIYRKYNSVYYPCIVSIDSVKQRVLNNNVLKEFYVTYSAHSQTKQDTWLEGIGSINNGLFNESCFGATGCYTTSYLLCYKENDVLLLQNKDFNTCYKETNINSVVTTLEDQAKLIEVFPNGIGLLTIRILNQQQGELTLFNMEGKQVLQQKIIETETQICLSISGTLIYQFTSEKGEVQTGKVMIK